jgi:transcriptional regulator with GAF, ATPase, and Fis domain
MSDPIETRHAGGAARSPSQMTVVVLSGSQKGTSKRVLDRLTVGKAPTSDLVLTDDTVSRTHCELVRSGEGLRLRDLGSTNGTRVDGLRVTDAFVQPGAILKVGEVELAVRIESVRLEVLPSDNTSFGEVLGESVPMRTIFAVLERIAATDATVLLQGETGTGKDVVARSIAAAGSRKDKPFVVVDCGAVNYSLIESELFGHERGAFTGAHAQRMGAFETAKGGTIFLDEIGELPLDMQPKLLRVLESREFRRVGGSGPIRTDVRLIAATKRDLLREVKLGKFREDLYFRLAVVPITMPPLRARRDDIVALARALFEKAKGSTTLKLPDHALSVLLAHDWPGNVRELRNVIERAVHIAGSEGKSELELVMMPGPALAGPKGYMFEGSESYRETRARYDAEFERAYVQWLLERHDGNISGAAREVKMDRKYLYDMAKKHGLRGDE